MEWLALENLWCEYRANHVLSSDPNGPLSTTLLLDVGSILKAGSWNTSID
jgi:hypothetical protein